MAGDMPSRRSAGVCAQVLAIRHARLSQWRSVGHEATKRLALVQEVACMSCRHVGFLEPLELRRKFPSELAAYGDAISLHCMQREERASKCGANLAHLTADVLTQFDV